MTDYSKTQRLDLMTETARALGWGARSGFNRTGTHTVLQQSDIERFSERPSIALSRFRRRPIESSITIH